MKPVYVVILMGAAAIGGGLVVRYRERPVQIAQARSIPPTVIAPPVPPAARVGPSNSVPVRSAPSESPEVSSETPNAPPEKPSAFSLPVHIGKPDPTPAPAAAPPKIVARTQTPPRTPAEPPAVIRLERNFVPTDPMHLSPVVPTTPTVAPSPALSPAPELKGVASVLQTPPQTEPTPQPGPSEANHATLRSGMLIAVRINEALSSNLNSPGDVFSGTLDQPLIADGFVIAERGAHVRGEVVESKSAGRGQGSSELAIRLREISASDGQRVHVVSQPWRRQGSLYGNRDLARNVYDTALTRGGAAVIRPATSITFRLDESVELTEKR